MPDAALPQPWPQPIPGLVHYTRDYRDILGRPLRGDVRITGAQRSTHGHTVIAAAAVTVKLDNGRLDVDLPAGDYQLAATLTTVDGERIREDDTVTLD